MTATNRGSISLQVLPTKSRCGVLSRFSFALVIFMPPRLTAATRVAPEGQAHQRYPGA